MMQIYMQKIILMKYSRNDKTQEILNRNWHYMKLNIDEILNTISFITSFLFPYFIIAGNSMIHKRSMFHDKMWLSLYWMKKCDSEVRTRHTHSLCLAYWPRIAQVCVDFNFDDIYSGACRHLNVEKRKINFLYRNLNDFKKQQFNHLRCNNYVTNN